MEKYKTPIFRGDMVTDDLHAMEANSMTLMSNRPTFMPQVSTLVGLISQYPSQVLNPSLMVDNNLTVSAAKSTQVPLADGVASGNEEIGDTGGTPLSITSHSLSMSSGLASTDLIQEIFNGESREKLKGKIKQPGSTMLGNYGDETVWYMEETRNRMCLCWYKQNI